MSAQDKTIKIQFGVDDASAAKAKRVISELVAEVKKLADVSSKVNFGGFGGGGGGGGSFGRVGAATGSGGQSVASQMAPKLNASTGGVTDGLTKAVQNTATLFRGAATGSREALKVMSDTLKRTVSDSDNEIKKLQRSLESLGTTYDKLKKRSGVGGGGFTDAGMSRVQDRFLETSERLQAQQGRNTKLRAAREEFEDSNAPGIMGGARRAFASAKGWMGTNVPSAGQAGQALSSIPGVSGLARMAAGPVGLIGGILSASSAVLGARSENQKANLGYAIDQPMFNASAKGTMGSIYGGNALAIRHGDLARSIALTRLAKDDAAKAISGNNMENMLQLRRNLNTPVGLEALAQGHFTAGLKGAAMGKLGSFAAGNIGVGQGGVNLATTGVQQVARDRQNAEQIALQAQMFQQRLEAKMAEDPEFNDRVNSRYSGSMGQLALARASGVSNRLRNVVGADGRRARIGGLAMLEGTANSQGYDVGEYVGGMQQMASTVGRSYMHRGTGSLLSAQAGGLHNIAQIRAMGSQFNGGEYRGFEKNIQNRIGRGGVDITAGAQITGLGAGMMSAGTFAGTGQGLMSTMLDAGFTGSGAGDMRAARAMQGGVGAMGAVMSGGLDPLQQALNASAAMKAAGGAAYGTKAALMHMDPATAMDALRNGKVPAELHAAGVTMPMLQKYMSAQNSTAFSRVSEGMLGGEAKGAVGRYKSAGGLSYMGSMNKTQRNIEARGLASGLVTAGGAPDFASGLARIRLQMASEGVLRGGKGKGAHSAASMDTFEGDAAKNVALGVVSDSLKNAKDEEMERQAVRNMGNVKDANEKALKFSQGAIGKNDPDVAISGVAQALTAFVRSLKGISEKQNARVGAPRTASR